MAVTNDGDSPIIMDTAGDELASIFQGRDMWKESPGVVKLHVAVIEFIASAASGVMKLRHKNKYGVIGSIAYQSPNLSVGENYHIRLHNAIDNVICDLDWPAGNMVLFHYE